MKRFPRLVVIRLIKSSIDTRLLGIRNTCRKIWSNCVVHGQSIRINPQPATPLSTGV